MPLRTPRTAAVEVWIGVVVGAQARIRKVVRASLSRSGRPGRSATWNANALESQHLPVIKRAGSRRLMRHWSLWRARSAMSFDDSSLTRPENSR